MAKADDDAKLIRLHAAQRAQRASITRLEEEADSLGGGITPETVAYEEKMGAEYNTWQKIGEKIIGIPARTPAGLRAKAEVMLVLLQDATGGIEDRMALSIVRDILAGICAPER